MDFIVGNLSLDFWSSAAGPRWVLQASAISPHRPSLRETVPLGMMDHASCCGSVVAGLPILPQPAMVG